MALNVPLSKKGEFVRTESAFRNFVTEDGSSGFPAASGRYHLYVSLACPFANRALIGRVLKGLDDVIGITIVHWLLTKDGWEFEKPEPINGKKYLREIYKLADPEYTGRVTVPVLWDKEKKTIVNNESSEILRMLSTAFNNLCRTYQHKVLSFYPRTLQKEIDDLNSWIYPMINNGVYRAGFSTSQEAYDTAVAQVFEGLDRVEGILAKRRYLTGDDLTEADIRLWTTLIRFDLVYVGHFKCNKKRIVDYPNLWGFTRDIYQMPGICTTMDFDHILKHYMASQTNVNPTGIVAIMPDLNHWAPHGRAAMYEGAEK